MGYAEIVSTVALAIAGATFVRNIMRDRQRVKITSAFYDGSESADIEPGPQPYIHVVVVNTGTRPLILRLIGGSDDGHGSSGTHLDHAKGGVRLGEHERWEYSIKKEDTVEPYAPGGDIIFTHMWIEDSLGNRHAIPNSYDYVPKLQAALFVKPTSERPEGA